ncbi:hypothetical protein HNY73_003909 [Argiope bruennichi]|uniref:DUF4817 domain-containing protein n=1 Tax=Argiope bruennichi TaxID=94029 RepID=A0A8T0FM76_ARGBR|nr:hypothetical protein HNY73_003909 [Argiope bruennichi]
MASYKHREVADMHLVYGMANCNGREALRMYLQKYPSRKMPSRSFFATIHRRLCETGSLDVHKPDSGRQRISRTVDAEERVAQALQRNPSTSIRVSRNPDLLLETYIAIYVERYKISRESNVSDTCEVSRLAVLRMRSLCSDYAVKCC